MQTDMKEIVINGISYVPKTEINQMATPVDGMKYCIVRADRTGVHAGYIESRNGREVVIRNSRRLWYWSGAASLSQLAMEGVKNPKDCKFPCEVNRVEILDVIEIIDCTEAARKSILEVPVWEKIIGGGYGGGDGDGAGDGAGGGYGGGYGDCAGDGAG